MPSDGASESGGYVHTDGRQTKERPAERTGRSTPRLAIIARYCAINLTYLARGRADVDLVARVDKQRAGAPAERGCARVKYYEAPCERGNAI